MSALTSANLRFLTFSTFAALAAATEKENLRSSQGDQCSGQISPTSGMGNVKVSENRAREITCSPSRKRCKSFVTGVLCKPYEQLPSEARKK